MLQTRVPSSLYEELAENASRLRVPVSNLVRNILEDSVRMVGNIVEGGFGIAEALGGQPVRERRPEIIGWQSLTAAKRLTCSRCGKNIAKGRRAWLGIAAQGRGSEVICPTCRKSLSGS
ncbi:MAG: hypothetical protein M5R36_05600 [Deltaproteobacteria bacterium]|nr:hypothetical protein [Deltaproteobacteria bacterium]